MAMHQAHILSNNGVSVKSISLIRCAAATGHCWSFCLPMAGDASICSQHQNSRWPELKTLRTSHVASAPVAVLPSLEDVHLDLGSTSVGLENLIMMHLPALEELTACVDVNRTCVTAKQVATKQHRPQLTLLNLNDSNIGLDSMLPLQGLALPALKVLMLSNSCIDATGMGDLAACALPNLEYIGLGWNEIDYDAMQHLSQARRPLLNTLSLNGHTMCPAAVQCLVSAALFQLSNLQLEECALTPGTFSILLKGKWPKMTCLELGEENMLSYSDVVAACTVCLSQGDCAFEHLLRALLKAYTDTEDNIVGDNSITLQAPYM